ncbi:ribosomal RNA methyltransferase RrmJ/FtsJ [Thermodesulfatator indicus DSM 15286]|uniref:Ribosomal RNA large subunit methyltransferase E n=1 Tax=Thermodesulfatator indicus (strain DSM 15286 / JCM 11887 / CIR29812) TaxID=667014 RepID=F8A834_THEID|nr:RlmE family RNA methyltransferase [Thermodesulfatator indicus]AEH45027.1 ribosomal RNA methyltransferase RrmJ/FtsJ [Thermodesulfatator indicus DSM 15286]
MPYKPRDYYAKKAKQEKYPARSVYKIKEADQKYRLLRRGQKVLDLGAAPGSWSKYALEKVGKNGLVVGVDLSPVKISAPNFVFLQQDIFELNPEELCEKASVSAFDAVLSDMAPKTTGDRSGDHFRSVHLAKRALEIAEKVLKPSGVFFVKVFEGEAFPGFVDEVKKRIGPVKRFRPKSTRSESREIFVLARKEK